MPYRLAIGAPPSGSLGSRYTSSSHAGGEILYPLIISSGGFPSRLVEVRCVCPAAVARERYVRRSKVRHAGHLDALRPAGELWNGQNTQPLGIAAVVTVDTTTEVDVPALVAAIRAAADMS